MSIATDRPPGSWLLALCAVLLCLAPGVHASSVCDDLRGGPGDLDGDGLLRGDDCDDEDSGAGSTPGEATGLRSPDPALVPFAHVFVWDAATDPGGTEPPTYDALRSSSASNFFDDPSVVCLETAGADLTFEDDSMPAPGEALFFLVRPRNSCGTGDPGDGQSGGLPLPRALQACDCTLACDDADACTDDTCSVGGGSCVHTPIEPTVLRQPDPVAVCDGSTVSFRVAASGSGNLGYQWFVGGAPVGNDAPLLQLGPVSAADNDSNITVQITDGCASTTSEVARLTVHPDNASCSGGLSGQEPPALAGRAGSLVDGGPGGSTASSSGDSMEASMESSMESTSTMDARTKNTGGVHLHSGEFVYRRVDLAIPGVGIDLIWGLTYRSRELRQGRMGSQWVDSFDRRVEWEDPGMPVNLVFHDGSTARVDLYTPGPGGCWSAHGQFAEICPDPTPGQGLRLTTASGIVYVFSGLDGTPTEGTLQRVVDRNGNSLDLSYDVAGRLTTLTDTLGRPTTLTYDGSNRVVEITDSSGRTVTYAYYSGEFGGEAGDLKSVTSPPVTGTSTGNDFADGTTHVFTYSQGHAFGELNHNLLTIQDPGGHVFLRNVYTSAEVLADPRFDRLDRQFFFSEPVSFGAGRGVRAFTYVSQTPALSNNFAVSKTTVRDRAGNVAAHFFDADGRMVMLQQHTGRAADLSIPTGEVLNPPVGPLRPGDPAFYETRFEYNPESMLTRVVQHNQSDLQFVYDSANPDPRLRANLLSATRVPGPPGGDQPQISESWTYTTPYGTEVCAGMSEGCLDTGSALTSWWGRGAGTPHHPYTFPKLRLDRSSSQASKGKVYPKIEIHPAAAAAKGKVYPKVEINLTSRMLGDDYIIRKIEGKRASPAGGPVGAAAKGKVFPKIEIHPVAAAARGKVYPKVEIKLTSGTARGRFTKGKVDFSYSRMFSDNYVIRKIDNNRSGASPAGGPVGAAARGKVFPKIEIHPAAAAAKGKVFPKVEIDLTSRMLGDGNIIRKINKSSGTITTSSSGGSTGWWGSGTGGARVSGYYKFGDIKGSSRSTSRNLDKATPIITQVFDKATPILAKSCGGASCPGAGGGRRGIYSEKATYGGKPGIGHPRAFPSTHITGRGTVVTLTYDANGNLTEMTQPPTSQNGGLPLQVITDEFEYDAAGRLTRHIDPEGRENVYTYHASGPQTGYLETVVVDDTGLQLTHTFQYDAVGNVTAVTDPRGHTTQLERNAHNQVVRVTEPAPFAYDLVFLRDANGRLRRVDVEDPTLTTLPRPYLSTHYAYDDLDRLVRVRSEVDELTDACVIDEFEYAANDRPAVVRSGEAVSGGQPNNTVHYEYDERDLLFRARAGDGTPDVSTSQFDYDGNGNLVTAHEGLEHPGGAHLTTLTYDGYNRLVTLTDPEDNVQTVHYDADDNVVSTRLDGETEEGVTGVNQRLFESTAIYDEMDRPLQVDVAHFDTLTGMPIGDGSSTTLYGYDRRSALVRHDDDTGSVTHLQYDSVGRLHHVTDAGLNTTEYQYDDNDNVISVTQVDQPTVAGPPAEVFVHSFQYDELDRLTVVEDPLLHVTTHTYDGRHNPILTEDSAGNVSRVQYDGLGRPLRFERDMTDNGQGSGSVVDTVASSVTYDDAHRVTSVTDLNDHTTQYAYDALDRLTTTTLADGTSHVFVWDAHHDLGSSTDPNGTAVTLTYDGLHRPTQVTVSPGAGVTGSTFETFTYDGLSRVVSGENDHSVITREYDSLSLPTNETALVDGAPPVLVSTASHDGDGNLTQMSYPSGRVLDFFYDNLDRLTDVTDGPVSVVHYDYIGPDRVLRESLANGVTVDHAYDGDGRVQRTTHTSGNGPGATVLVDYTYAHDDADNLVERADQLAGGEFEQFEYDSLYRMVASHRGTPGSTTDIDYDLDRAGNRQTVTGGPDAGTYVLDPANPPADAQVHQYTSTPRGDRLYDENGNLAHQDDGSPTERDSAYDFRDRLVTTSEPGGTEVHYHYDVFGRRVSRLEVSGPVLAPTQRWSYYLGMCLEEEELAAGGSTTVYLEIAGEPLLVLPGGGGSLYLHADALGSVAAVTDGSGTVLEQVDYGDFGQPELTDGTGTPIPAPTVGNPFLFRGMRYESDTGFYHLGDGSYLDVSSGRSTSRRCSGDSRVCCAVNGGAAWN